MARTKTVPSKKVRASYNILAIEAVRFREPGHTALSGDLELVVKYRNAMREKRRRAMKKQQVDILKAFACVVLAPSPLLQREARLAGEALQAIQALQASQCAVPLEGAASPCAVPLEGAALQCAVPLEGEALQEHSSD